MAGQLKRTKAQSHFSLPNPLPHYRSVAQLRIESTILVAERNSARQSRSLE